MQSYIVRPYIANNESNEVITKSLISFKYARHFMPRCRTTYSNIRRKKLEIPLERILVRLDSRRNENACSAIE